MRDVLVLISFDTLKFITPIKVRGNHKIVSNIWNPRCATQLLTGRDLGQTMNSHPTTFLPTNTKTNEYKLSGMI